MTSSSPHDAGASLDTAAARYKNELADRDARFAALANRDARLGNVRVALFLLLLMFGFVAAFAAVKLPFILLSVVAFVAFLGVAIFNETIRDSMEQLRIERRVLKQLIARLERDWAHLGKQETSKLLEGLELPRVQQEVADDLDLFGEGSLFQLVAMVGTKPGARTLARWLAEPALAEVAQERAIAINRLAPARDERLKFYVTAATVGQSTGNPDRFLEWAVGPEWLGQRPWLRAWAIISTIIATLALVALVASGIAVGIGLIFKVCLAALFGLLVINFAVTAIFLGPAHEIFSIAMSSRRSVAEYRELIAAAQSLHVGDANDSPRDIAAVYEHLVSGDGAADRGMAALARVASLGSMRQSAATFLVYLPLQAFGLWDVWVLQWLETWQRQYGRYTPEWFASLGQLEAMMSLAALRDEYPHWAMPVWVQSSGSKALVAKQIGHPLLRDAVRVCNDVQIGPTGEFLLVTGSNMSGKSTLLRSVGLNVALAGAGAPVCASEFSLPSIQLATSIRVRDNLREGVSFYMAELYRLRGVVDQARIVAQANDRVLMFLLDEILQGTNSRERQIAVSQVLETLVEYRAIGAISTHDLELADDATLKSLAHVVHFRELIQRQPDGREEMTFDYRMRQGVSPTTNALRLLEIVGLKRPAGD